MKYLPVVLLFATLLPVAHADKGRPAMDDRQTLRRKTRDKGNELPPKKNKDSKHGKKGKKNPNKPTKPSDPYKKDFKYPVDMPPPPRCGWKALRVVYMLRTFRSTKHQSRFGKHGGLIKLCGTALPIITQQPSTQSPKQTLRPAPLKCITPLKPVHSV